MFNVRPEKRLFGFHVEPPEPPGFRMNADGSVGKASLDRPSFSDRSQDAGRMVLATLSDPALEPLVPEPPFLKAVPAEPSPPPPQDWPEKTNRLAPPFDSLERLYWLEKGNRLGIPEGVMRDPY